LISGCRVSLDVVANWLNEDVDRRVSAGHSLGRIVAELVDEVPVDEDRRAALWLYAWLRTRGTPAAASPRLLDSAA
jgi:hypothetical protein